MTTEPNELMEPIHNRMPVILAARDYSRWLDPRPGAATGGPAPPLSAEQMRSWPVSNRVGNVRNNDSQLLEQF